MIVSLPSIKTRFCRIAGVCFGLNQRCLIFIINEKMKQLKNTKTQTRNTIFILKESQVKRLIKKLISETSKGGKSI